MVKGAEETRRLINRWKVGELPAFWLHTEMVWSVLTRSNRGGVVVKEVRTLTDKEVRQFYDSRAWRRKRLDILARDFYECQDCKARLEQARKEGKVLTGEARKIRRATQVHHVKELRDNPELGFDEDNLISLCTQCHNIRHGRNPKRFVPKKKRVTEEMW